MPKIIKIELGLTKILEKKLVQFFLTHSVEVCPEDVMEVSHVASAGVFLSYRDIKESCVCVFKIYVKIVQLI